LAVGMERYQVVAVLGKPVQSYKKEDSDVDIFQVDPNGRYTGTKAAVTSFNIAADVLTLGMWEAVATPAEMLTRHDLTTYQITYGPNGRVTSIVTDPTPPQVASADVAPLKRGEPPPVTAADVQSSGGGWSKPAAATTPAATEALAAPAAAA